MDNSTTTASQPVVFSTQTQYPLPSQKFMIPVSWRRYQLSQLVNKALSLEKPVPFDFLVRGESLHTTLSEWCSENGVGEVRGEFIDACGRLYNLLNCRNRRSRSSISSRLCLLRKSRIFHMKIGYRQLPVILEGTFL